MTVTVAVDKNFKIKMINNKLKWTESILNSFREDEIDNMYQYILDVGDIYKAKIGYVRYSPVIRIPVACTRKYDLKRGDRYNIKVNPLKKEIYLVFDKKGKCSIKADSKIFLPPILVDKKLVKIGDDMMIKFDDDRLTLKSFSFMQ